MTEAQDLYYRATVSGTKFYSEPSDAEDVGLLGYRGAELEEMERFFNSDEQVLVMGGMSATSKTFLAKKVAKDRDLAFYGVQSGGREYEEICLDVAAAADFIVNGGNRSLRRSLVDPKVLIIDEGTCFLRADSNRHRSVRDVLKELLRRYAKLIILGGGADYTSEEQSDGIAELLPADAKISVFPFKVKILSDRQTKELVALSLAKDDVYKKVSDVIAETCLRYFRFTRRVWMVSGRGGDFFPSSFNNPRNYRESFMPDECFEVASRIQEEMCRRAMQEIERRIR